MAIRIEEVFEKDIPTRRTHTWMRELYEQIRLRMEQTKPPAALRIVWNDDLSTKTLYRISRQVRLWFDKDMPGRIMVHTSTREKAIYVRYAPGSKGR